jgi:hypothetical protein
LYVLTLAAVSNISVARADDLEEVCNFVHEKLRAVERSELTMTRGEFVHDGMRYKGCITKLKGDSTKVAGPYYPSDLFYPFKDSPRYRLGWRVDQEADGPDGTSFRIFKGNTFCLIEGSWDGGDDSDPEYIPDTEFEVVVRCGKSKQ